MRKTFSEDDPEICVFWHLRKSRSKEGRSRHMRWDGIVPPQDAHKGTSSPEQASLRIFYFEPKWETEYY
ncbi:hypothetical protein FQA47_018718 [Oryzias melastigma]|uniref:Uncharacterized protein n=1 Tax=Oryzias melastigma TaxID=30732 RepID=A0A834F7G9_ORYME|nr:hypothetical protein FQA47_018718 [Oryzias melastigma]